MSTTTRTLEADLLGRAHVELDREESCWFAGDSQEPRDWTVHNKELRVNGRAVSNPDKFPYLIRAVEIANGIHS